MALDRLENLKKIPEGTMEADSADLATGWVTGSDTEFRIIILMGDIFRIKHSTLKEMETDNVFLLKCWHFDLSRTEFMGMRPEKYS